MKQIITFLRKEKKVKDKNILYINFEYEIFSLLNDSKKLSEIINNYFLNID
jgi:hypothetical protein